MKKWLCFALATLLLVCVGCDRAEEKSRQTETTTSTTTSAELQQNPDLKAEDCYTYTEHEDGTYSYEVEWRGGGTLCTELDMDRPVSFTVTGEDWLVIYGQAGTGVGARWAKVCDIQRGRVSDVFGAYLAAVDNRVAYLDFRTDEYHVFVVDAFDAVEPIAVCTLEDAIEGVDPITDFSLSEEGVLSVTYSTGADSKTVTVDMKQE